MIQKCIPSVEEIMSHILVQTECGPSVMLSSVTIITLKCSIGRENFVYSPFNVYMLGLSDEDFQHIISEKKLEFAKHIHRIYADKFFKEEETNMTYNLYEEFMSQPIGVYTNNISQFYENLMKAGTVQENNGIGLTLAPTPSGIKGSVLPLSMINILASIKDYKIYNNKVLVVWFMDGSFTKAVASDGDEFNFYTGLMVCLFKKYLGENGSKKFNKMMEVAMKKLGDIDKNKEKQNEEKTLAEKKRHKAEMKRKAKALKKKEEAIDIQKQGFIRAMQEMGEDDRK